MEKIIIFFVLLIFLSTQAHAQNTTTNYITIIDLTSYGFKQIYIYQNDNVSTRYIMTRNLSQIFTITDVNYDFVLEPNVRMILNAPTTHFLNYLYGYRYYIILILLCLTIIAIIITKKK